MKMNMGFGGLGDQYIMMKVQRYANGFDCKILLLVELNVQFQLLIDRVLFHFTWKQKTRQTLNEKISQLNSAIDKVSSRLRGGNNSPKVPVESDPEVEATI